MSLKSLFNILLDQSSDESNPLGSFVEGTNYAGAAHKEGLVGFSFKDSTGAVVLPSLNDEGAIVVSEDSGTIIDDFGEHAGDKAAFQDICTLVLTLEQNYSKICGTISSSRQTEWELVAIDDVGVTDTETLVAKFVTHDEPFYFTCVPKVTTVGGTLIQNLVLRAQNQDAVTPMYGTLCANELPS